MFVLTKSGRVVDFSPRSVKELVDGRWVAPERPVFIWEFWEGKALSEEEVSQMVKSGR